MANLAKIHRPAVGLEFEDGVTRHMSFRLSAFANMEQKFGSVDAAMEALNKGKISDIIYMLWLGLVWEDKTLTEEQVGDLIDIREMTKVTEALQTVLQMDAPMEQVEATDNVVPMSTNQVEADPNE